MPAGLDEAQWGEFDRLARTYSWDLPLPEAREYADRLFRRVMDMGLLEDVVAMERAFGRRRLEHALTTAPAGALRPKSWAWWHYRLDLVEPGTPPPPLPVRRVG